MSPFEETPMKRKRRTFDPSFKLEIVNTIKNQGLSVSQVAKDMNLTESTVRRWVQQVGEELVGSIWLWCSMCLPGESWAGPWRQT